MAFPATVLGLKGEIQLAGTWTDISSYLQHDEQDSQQHPAAVTITRGRQDELATSATPSQATFKLWNADGRFCPRNPLGAYYPRLTRNTPVRFSIPAASTRVRIDADETSLIGCPTSAGLSVTGDLELQAEIEPLDYNGGYILAKLDFGSENCWGLVLNGDGTLTLFWSTTGSNFLSAESDLPIPVGHLAVRATLKVNNGSGGHTITFYTGPSISAATWTQLGAAIVQSGTTSIFAGAAGVFAGSGAWMIYGFRVLNGIGGTVEASPDFTTATAGASSFTDGQGNVWTPTGTAEFSNRDYRFTGQISALPVTWDPTGNDVWATATASGVLRRLQQGTQPNVMSAMRRAMQFQTGGSAPVAYWPMEDGASATAIAPVIGNTRMYWTGSPTLANGSNFACSNPLPQANGASFKGSVVAPSGFHWTDNVFRFLWDVPSGGEADGSVVVRTFHTVTAGTVDHIDLIYHTAGAGSLAISAFNAAGTQLGTTGTIAYALDGNQWRVSVNFKKNGTGADVEVEVLQPGAVAALVASFTLASTTPGALRKFSLGSAGITSSSFGHASVDGLWDTLFDVGSPLNAWNGELAGNRFVRLCTENGIPYRVYGPPGRTVKMGYQTPDTLMNLLQACEDADRGQIYESRDTFALAYRTLFSMTNQAVLATLDYNLDHMAPPLEPTDDDLYIVNDVTVTQASTSSGFDGSLAIQTLNDGSAMSIGVIGDYANSYDISLASDNQLQDEAGWILHVSTDNEERYPTVIVNLASTQSAVATIAESVRSCDIGSHAQIIHIPSFLPPGPVDLLTWGYTESLGDFCEEHQFNTVPETPYETAVADDPIRGRANTPGSVLTSGLTSSATTFPVSTPTDTWTTHVGDFPFDIYTDGERMTVTSIGATNVNFLTGQNAGFEGGIGTWVTGGNSTIADSSAQAHTGSDSLAMTSVASGTMFAQNCANANILTQGLPCIQGDVIGASAWFRAAVSARSCQIGVGFYNSSGTNIAGDFGTLVNDNTSGWTESADGGVIVAPAGAAFCLAFVAVTTGAASEVHYIDDVVLTNRSSQIFTVTRSVNGIVKAHGQSDIVTLEQPIIASLTA